MNSSLPVIILFQLFPCLSTAQNPNLIAEYHPGEKLVELRWQNSGFNVTGFTLQRCFDLISWQDIYTVSKDHFNKRKQEKYSDKLTGTLKIHYRLKITNADSTWHSTPITLIIGNKLGSWNIFPVPVKDLLNLQYTGSEALTGVIAVFIQNSMGYILIRKRYSSLNRTIRIPVDNLGSGVYDIRVAVNDEMVWGSRFIK